MIYFKPHVTMSQALTLANKLGMVCKLRKINGIYRVTLERKQ